MLFLPSLNFPLLFSLTCASPSPALQRRDGTTTASAETEIATLHVTNFGAFLSAEPGIPSHVSFHVSDTRADWSAEVDCVFVTNDSYPFLYVGGYWPCRGDTGIGFWLADAFLRIHRPFLLDVNDP
jgi:hypothetical protein